MKISTQTMARGKETVDWVVIPREGAWEVYYGIPHYPMTFAFGLLMENTTKEQAEKIAVDNLFNYMEFFEED